jgi:hypothetical protein
MRNHFHCIVIARPKAVATQAIGSTKCVAARAEFLGCFVAPPRNDDAELFA